MSIQKAIGALQRSGGLVEQASEQELADAVVRADRTGMFACPHTGVALAALIKLAARGEIKRDERVVVISTASGLKFTDFKADYHASRLPGIASTQANRPIELPNDYDQIRRRLDLAIPA